MKFSYLIFAVLLVTGYQSYAQNTYPWPITGPIGIGTNNATLGLLHLNGSTADLLSMSQTNPTQVIQFNAYNNVDFRIIQRSNAVMTLWTNALERMRIDQNGNVGIGTNTPVSLLDVNGNIAMAATAGLFLILIGLATGNIGRMGMATRCTRQVQVILPLQLWIIIREGREILEFLIQE